MPKGKKSVDLDALRARVAPAVAHAVAARIHSDPGIKAALGTSGSATVDATSLEQFAENVVLPILLEVLHSLGYLKNIVVTPPPSS